MNDNDPGMIESGWTALAQGLDFCCDYHRETFRTVYFAGAMTAMAAATTWQPGAEKVEINRSCLHLVCDELDVENFKAESESEGAGHA